VSWTPVVATTHRYIGLTMCLLFAMWFATGLVMLFEPFPALGSADRFACLEPIDVAGSLSSVASRVAAFDQDAVARIRLTSRDGRPVLHVHRADRIDTFAMGDGAAPPVADAGLARRAAAGCGFGSPRAVQTIADDQWTVHQSFDPHRPLHKVVLDDAAGTVVYVSSRTGEVVQKTTASARAWNWVGAVPHWIYPTVIRRHWALWDRLVFWLAAAGTAGAMSGLLIGVLRWRRGTPGSFSPFRGALYLHHLTGLSLGLIVLAWILSGMVSMDHGRLFSLDAPAPEQVRALAGDAPFAGDPARLRRRLHAATPAVKEIEWLRVDGRRYLAFRAAPASQLLVPVDDDGGAVMAAFDADALATVAPMLLPGAAVAGLERLETYDLYYYGREHAARPLPVLRVRFADAASTWLHVDLGSGTLIERLDSSRRAYRFLFNALHSHDLPWMLEHVSLRRAWMALLCAGGFAFSLNGVWLSWKWLRRPRDSRRRRVPR